MESFLKEKINCRLTDDEAISYETIEQSNNHPEVFSHNYPESDVLSFIMLLNNFFINICHSTVDKTDTASRYTFNLDYLMYHVDVYYLLLFGSHNIEADEQKKIIIDRAIKYGLIKKNEIAGYDSLGILQIIIELAQERCKNLVL